MKTFNLPDLGEGLAEAEIREWYVKVGEEVTVDQPLVSMETAKAVVDVPSPYAGKITELHGEPNTIIKTGAPLVSFFMQNMPADQGSVVGKLETSEKKWEESEAIIAPPRAKSSIKIMPAARLLANQMQIDLNNITPTGPQGQITVEDVKQCLSNQHSHQSGTNNGHEPLHGVRRTMAQVMNKSHQAIVPVTIVEDADISAWDKKSDLTLYLLKAMVAAVNKEPSLNAWFDGEKLERQLLKAVNIGLAMDTESGLFVPVLKNVAEKSTAMLREEINQYKERVKTRSIAPSDFQGATISLSNFGTMAGRYATPIVVPPMVAILGCGRSRETPIVREGKMVIGRLLPLSLTIDHRAVTGGEASRFLGAVVEYLRTAPDSL